MKYSTVKMIITHIISTIRTLYITIIEILFVIFFLNMLNIIRTWCITFMNLLYFVNMFAFVIKFIRRDFFAAL